MMAIGGWPRGWLRMSTLIPGAVAVICARNGTVLEIEITAAGECLDVLGDAVEESFHVQCTSRYGVVAVVAG